jgi:hypothetical protein
MTSFDVQAARPGGMGTAQDADINGIKAHIISNTVPEYDNLDKENSSSFYTTSEVKVFLIQ